MFYATLGDRPPGHMRLEEMGAFEYGNENPSTILVWVSSGQIRAERAPFRPGPYYAFFQEKVVLIPSE